MPGLSGVGPPPGFMMIQLLLAQLRIAIAPGPAPRLLVVVHPGSERTLEPALQDSSFAEKQEFSPCVRGRRPQRASRFG
jgi:hypothetical protein